MRPFSSFPVFFIRPCPPAAHPALSSPICSSLVMAQRRDEIFSPYPPFHLPERTCKVFTRIYGRFSIHNRGVPVENKASSIVATHVSVPINRCSARLPTSLSFFLFLSSLFWCTLSSRSFIFATVAFHSGFLVALLLFLIPPSFLSFFYYSPFSFSDSLGRGSEWKGNVEEISL